MHNIVLVPRLILANFPAPQETLSHPSTWSPTLKSTFAFSSHTFPVSNSILTVLTLNPYFANFSLTLPASLTRHSLLPAHGNIQIKPTSFHFFHLGFARFHG